MWLLMMDAKKSMIQKRISKKKLWIFQINSKSYDTFCWHDEENEITIYSYLISTKYVQVACIYLLIFNFYLSFNYGYVIHQKSTIHVQVDCMTILHINHPYLYLYHHHLDHGAIAGKVWHLLLASNAEVSGIDIFHSISTFTSLHLYILCTYLSIKKSFFCLLTFTEIMKYNSLLQC